LRAAAVVALAGNRKGIADDRFEYQPVRSRGEAVANAEFYIDFLHLEVGDRIQLLAWLGQRQEIADLAEIGIIFEADKSVLAEARAWMQNVMNRRWLLAGYPEGMPTLENWTLDRQPVPDPGPGQILVKAKWLSVDPYMRGRMSPSANYTKGAAIGEVMQGGGVGEVVASNHPAWKVGEIAESMAFGWQEWSVLTPELGPRGRTR
jgi:hypothetical protein